MPLELDECRDPLSAETLPSDQAEFDLGLIEPAAVLDGEIDARRLSELITMASPMRVGFHRAFGKVRDQDDSLELLVSLQVDHILTSDGAKTAMDGDRRIKQLVERAGDRIGIIAGGSVTAANAPTLVGITGVQSVHGRAYQGLPSALASL